MDTSKILSPVEEFSKALRKHFRATSLPDFIQKRINEWDNFFDNIPESEGKEAEWDEFKYLVFWYDMRDQLMERYRKNRMEYPI